MTTRFLSAAALVLLFPAAALASGDAHGDLSVGGLLHSPEFIGAIVNFGLLLFIIVKFGGKPFGEFLRTRRSEMEQAMVEAAEMKSKAEARYKEYTERLGTLDQELKKLKDDIETAAEEDKKKIMAAAEESNRRLKVETEGLIEQHAAALGASVRREVVAAAIDAAEEMLSKQVGPHDQQRLADEFKQRVSESTRNGGAA